eukprot:scaffold83_cov181-Amphora_coffeaeformis.AAC.25
MPPQSEPLPRTNTLPYAPYIFLTLSDAHGIAGKTNARATTVGPNNKQGLCVRDRKLAGRLVLYFFPTPTRQYCTRTGVRQPPSFKR